LRRLSGVFPAVFTDHGVQQDAGQHVVAALRDAHPDIDPGRLIHLGTTANPAHCLRWPVMRAERARVDELVQVERGQLTRDPDGRRGLITGHRTPGSADVLVHPPPQVIVQSGDGPDRGISRHSYMVTPTYVPMVLMNQHK
jgi:hypothetical protein